MQDIKLKQTYLSDQLFRGNIRMMPALSLFVPVQGVILAFNELCNHRSIDEQPVLDYFKTNYNWFLNKIPQKNNNLEEWHTPFLHHVQTNTSNNLEVYQHIKTR